MPRPRRATQPRQPTKRPIEAYEHRDQERLNNPPVGLVTPETDRDAGRKTYAYDPHLDPQLQWAGKTEHTSFDIEVDADVVPVNRRAPAGRRIDLVQVQS